ncbi:hypothetical protein SNEBB_005612 [Seison nebaliae]|nr:hypothetical protein SNEBB_005612 [Seison nebaliae]
MSVSNIVKHCLEGIRIGDGFYEDSSKIHHFYLSDAVVSDTENDIKTRKASNTSRATIGLIEAEKLIVDASVTSHRKHRCRKMSIGHVDKDGTPSVSQTAQWAFGEKRNNRISVQRPTQKYNLYYELPTQKRNDHTSRSITNVNETNNNNNNNNNNNINDNKNNNNNKTSRKSSISKTIVNKVVKNKKQSIYNSTTSIISLFRTKKNGSPPKDKTQSKVDKSNEVLDKIVTSSITNCVDTVTTMNTPLMSTSSTTTTTTPAMSLPIQRKCYDDPYNLYHQQRLTTNCSEASDLISTQNDGIIQKKSKEIEFLNNNINNNNNNKVSINLNENNLKKECVDENKNIFDESNVLDDEPLENEVDPWTMPAMSENEKLENDESKNQTVASASNLMENPNKDRQMSYLSVEQKQSAAAVTTATASSLSTTTTTTTNSISIPFSTNANISLRSVQSNNENEIYTEDKLVTKQPSWQSTRTAFDPPQSMPLKKKLQPSNTILRSESSESFSDSGSYAAFAELDLDGDGAITVSELGKVMRSLGMRPSDVELRTMINSADQDGNGTIEFDEFRALFRKTSHPAPTTTKPLRAANDWIIHKFHDIRRRHHRLMSNKRKRASSIANHFRSAIRPSKKDIKKEDEKMKNNYLFDTFKAFDRDGNGLISIEEISAVMKYLGEDLTDADLREMMMEADRDGDGYISFEDFNSLTQDLDDIRKKMDKQKKKQLQMNKGKGKILETGEELNEEIFTNTMGRTSKKPSTSQIDRMLIYNESMNQKSDQPSSNSEGENNVIIIDMERNHEQSDYFKTIHRLKKSINPVTPLENEKRTEINALKQIKTTPQTQTKTNIIQPNHTSIYQKKNESDNSDPTNLDQYARLRNIRRQYQPYTSDKSNNELELNSNSTVSTRGEQDYLLNFHDAKKVSVIDETQLKQEPNGILIEEKMNELNLNEKKNLDNHNNFHELDKKIDENWIEDKNRLVNNYRKNIPDELVGKNGVEELMGKNTIDEMLVNENDEISQPFIPNHVQSIPFADISSYSLAPYAMQSKSMNK